MIFKNKKELYESYKILWLFTHNINIEEISIMADQWKADVDYKGTFEEYLEEFKFGNKIWISFENFIKIPIPIFSKNLLKFIKKDNYE